MSDDHAERCLARYFEIIGERPERFVNVAGRVDDQALPQRPGHRPREHPEPALGENRFAVRLLEHEGHEGYEEHELHS